MLIGHHTELPRTLKNFLVANSLCFYDDAIAFLKKEPNGKYSSIEKIVSANPIVNKINIARQKLGIDDHVIEEWKGLVKKDFYLANCWALPEFQVKLGAEPMASFPPPFTLGDYVVRCKQRNQVLVTQQQELFKLARKRKEQNDELKKRLCIVEKICLNVHKVICPTSGNTRDNARNHNLSS